MSSTFYTEYRVLHIYLLVPVEQCKNAPDMNIFNTVDGCAASSKCISTAVMDLKAKILTSTVQSLALKITVKLREDLYQILKQKYGPKGISEAINVILAEVLLKGEGMFGTMPMASLKGLRYHRDRM